MKKKYEIVYEKIRADVVDGSVGFGKRLPSKRAAAELFGTSVITVEHAYELLESEGYVEAKARSGYYSCYSPSGVIAEREYSPAAVCSQPSDEECFPFSTYAKAVRATLNDYGDFLTVKTDGSGSGALKSAIKNYLKTSRGIAVDERRIIIGSGAEYLYGTIVELLGASATFAVEAPSYERIRETYESSGAKTDDVLLGGDGVLREELKRTTANVLHVTPYRSFPSGITASTSKRAEYLRWATERGGYVIEDDYESEFSLSANLTETLFGACDDDRVIYVNTFSKTIFPSMRVAYMLLPPDLADAYYARLGFRSCTVPALEQLVLAKLIDDGSFVRHLNRVRRARKRAEKSTD